MKFEVGPEESQITVSREEVGRLLEAVEGKDDTDLIVCFTGLATVMDNRKAAEAESVDAPVELAVAADSAVEAAEPQKLGSRMVSAFRKKMPRGVRRPKDKRLPGYHYTD